MTEQSPFVESPDQVLSTLNKDGSRRWLCPRVSPGRFHTGRRLVAYGLIVFFIAMPWFRINGKPPILLDIIAREFTFFGKTFLPTDTLLLMLLVAGVFVLVFLMTALFGRLWCGWACPQTVYMEFIYRPIERFFDGQTKTGRRKGPRSAVRLVLKYVAFLIVSLIIAHIFLAYFVGVDELFQWMQRSPLDHPTAFIVVAFVTGMMMFDFAFFREQTCIVACPYGRLQSVMLDRSSLIISYDVERGEPRGAKRRARKAADSGDVALPQLGDCIDCKMCVTTCPTGIDIRQGLQMECIGCAQCIDACDAVMDKIDRPRGLIRYSSEEAMERGKAKLIRPRVIVYPLILSIVATLFVVTLVGKTSADVTVLRSSRTPYQTMSDGRVRNDIHVKIVNRSEAARSYSISVSGITDAELSCASCPVTIEPGETSTIIAYILTPAHSFENGRSQVTIEVTDDAEFAESLRYRIQGPFAVTESDVNNPEAEPEPSPEDSDHE